MITIASVDTDYGQIAVRKNRATGALAYLQGDHYQSEADRHGISLAPYIHALFGLLRQSGSQKVLMIGCGGGTLATMLVKAGCDVTIVDINPSAFFVARKFFGLPSGAACHVADGYAFVSAASEIYDAVVLDAYDGGNIPDHLRTIDFLRQVKNCLKPAGGCLLANVHVHHDLDMSADAFAATLSKIWPTVRLLDARGRLDRNAVLMTGSVSSLKRPSLILRPQTDAAEIEEELRALAFRPWHDPLNAKNPWGGSL